MPRQARQASGTGIYHVMMRGINHQNIFEEQEDYYQFLNTLGAHRGESAWNGNHRNSLAGEEGFKCPAGRTGGRVPVSQIMGVSNNQ